MTRLTLQLLGPFVASYGEQPLSHFRTKAVQALFIYLACQPETHRRESLMALLFPDVTQESAQNSLRQALYHLRQAIPEVNARNGDQFVPFLLSDRQMVQVNHDAGYDLDVATFEHALNGPEAGWPDAMALYRGDFLGDFYLPDSAPFEEWVHARRTDLRRQAMEALDSLIATDMEQGDFHAAEELARQQLTIDNLHERGHRRLMEILVRLGQRSQALAQYETCRRLLAEELGAEPSPKTEALYEQIRTAELGTAVQAVDRVRGYDLKEELGAGAFGVVYRAVQPAVGREVAVKIISPQYANQPDFIRRFEAEARIVARLEHPHIVPLYDYWREPDGAYLVMRYLRGGNLNDLLANGPCDLETTVKIMDQITGALALAHARQIVHRDIKPANILLDEEGNAYLSDFGIAKELTRDAALTQEGQLVGSPAYLAPEQVLGQAVSPQTDVYSLGVVLFELLTGEHPFRETPVAELFYRHAHEPLPSARDRNPELPAAVDAIIQQATAKTEAGRYPDARALALALQEAAHGTTIPVVIEVGELVNPYKGLRPFEEADAADFFGRQALVEQLLARMKHSDGAARFLAVVGPSGSGKSSVVKAGLLPALRQGALPGSEQWFVVQMTPGARPLDELEIGLLRVAATQPAGLNEQLRRDAHGLVRAARLVLPDDETSLLLVVDQFEELFASGGDPSEREHFLQLLATAASEANSPVRLLITLRADFYDRPLLHPDFGRLVKERTEVILPLTTAELAEAITAPATRAGAELEEGLATAIVAGVAEEVGALPMFQYALTELFARRDGRLLTRKAYDDVGGVAGALARRAEDVYMGLAENERQVARQLFLRLVTLGEGVEDTRRRALRSELEAIGTAESEGSAVVAAIIDTFGRARLLTFDRDRNSREPTVEVAHEALLREWPRLREWLDESRDDVRLQRFLAAAAAEWQAGGKDGGLLLRGTRLDQFAVWMDETSLSLTAAEREFLAASLAARQARRAEEEARRQRELQTARQLAETEKARAEEQSQAAAGLRRRALYLAAVLVVAVLFAIAAGIFGQQSRQNANAAATSEAEAIANSERAAQAADAEATAAAEAQANARAAEEAYSQSLAAHADNALANGDTTTALALALAAVGNSVQPPELAQLTLREAAYAPGLHQLYRVAELFPGTEGRIYSLAMSPVAQEALIGFEDGSLILWDVTEEEEVRRLDGHQGVVRAVAFSPDGRRALSGGSDRDIILWDLQSGREIRRLQGHDGWVRTVAFSPDGLTALSGGFAGDSVNSVSNPGQLFLWDLASGEQIQNFEGHPSGVVAARFTPDGRAIVASSGFWSSADSEYSLILWDTESGEKIRDFAITGSNDNYGLAISPDGRTVLTGNSSLEVVSWDLDTGQRMTTLDGHDGTMVTSVAFTPDGRLALSGDSSGRIILWDLATGTPVMRTRVQTTTLGGWHDDDGTVLNLAMGQAGRLALSSGGDGTFALWDLSDAAEIRRFLGHQTSTLLDAKFTPDGKGVLTGEWGDAFGVFLGPSNSMRLFDLETGRQVRSFEGHTAGIVMIDVSADGRRALTGSQDGTIRLWDLETGEELQQILAHSTGVFAVDLSPDGHRALSASIGSGAPDSGIRLWNLETGEEIVHPVKDGSYNFVVFTQDGQTAYFQGSADDDYNFGLYNLASGQLIRGYAGSFPPGPGFTLHPDGRSVFLANNMNMPAVEWDLETDEEIRAFGQHPGARTMVKVSPDGRLLLVAAAGDPGSVSLWDLETGLQIRRFRPDGICCVDFDISPDSHMAVTPGGGGTAILWDLTLPVAIEDVRSWITENRYVRELTCDERALYRIEPLCEG